MANITWIGDAVPVAQVDDGTPGTIADGNTYTITSGGAAVTYTATATDTLEDVLNGLVALAAAQGREFSDFTVANSGNTKLTFTATVAGEPFTITLSATGTGTFVKSPVTASEGPHDWIAENFSGSALPTNGDVVYLEHSDVDIKNNLDQSGTSGTITIIRRASYTGRVGRPVEHTNGYPEYRPRKLIAPVIELEIGFNDGEHSDLFYLDMDNQASPDIRIRATGEDNADNTHAVILENFTTGDLDIEGGNVDVAPFGDVTTTITNLRASGDAQVRCGKGVDVTNIITAGTAIVEHWSPTTSIISYGGDVICQDGAGGTVDLRGGNVTWNSSGDIATKLILDHRDSLFDLGTLLAPQIDVAGCEFNAGRINNPHDRVSGWGTTTNIRKASFER